MRVLYLGMLGEFSRLPLAQLLDANVDVCGVVVPGEKSAGDPPINLLPPQERVTSLPLLTPYRALNIVHLAWEHGIPAFELNRLSHPGSLATLAQLQPDVAAVACFSRRIPAPLLALPPHGFLNLHPSRLPDYRGPEPIFWQLRDGVNPLGVTLHVMDEGLDTGDVVGQTAVSLPDGASRHTIDALAAAAGADLLLTALQNLAQGVLPCQSQLATEGSYQPLPQAADFQLDVGWSARRAFNFMRGTAEYGWPYSLLIEGRQLRMTEALAYEPDGVLERGVVGNGREAHIQFSPGILHTRLQAPIWQEQTE
ncbi:MAG: formyltransferase family protein [Anaerolineae bacterium]